MRMTLVVLLALWTAPVFAEPWDIVPPPRGQWTVDQTGKVSSTTVGEINRLAHELDASGAGQLGVLVMNSTSGVNPRDFATGVFNSWGVGHSGSNDGVLIFVAVGDRKSEIILGTGSKLRSGQTDVVMRDDMVANMKRGDLNAALLSSARSLDGLLRRAVGKQASYSPDDNSGLGPNSYVTPTVRDTPMTDDKLVPYIDGAKTFPERSPRSWVVDLSEVLSNSERAQLDVAASDAYVSNQARVFFLVVNNHAISPDLGQLVTRFVGQVRPLSKLPVAVIAIDVGRNMAQIHLPESVVTNMWEFEQVRAVENNLVNSVSSTRIEAMIKAQQFAQAAIVVGIPSRPMGEAIARGIERNKGVVEFGGAGGIVFGLFMLRRWNRKRVRTCEHCKNPRQLLGDAAEDKHLNSSQMTEESVGSVDYDVWWCGRCDDVLVLRYGAIFSSYSTCPQCSARTRTSNTTTLSHATEYSTGLQQIDESCANCSYRNSYTRTTARIERSSSSSSSWSSSSSSSGSSFGGGSSSGGGSSGSW